MRKLVLLLVVLFAVAANASAVNVKEHGVKGDGKTDDTVAVQAVLDSGVTEVYFPDGTYLLGTITVPGDMTIRFALKAVYKINPDKVKVGPASWGKKGKRVILLGGDRITLDGLNFDFVGPDGKELGVKAIKAVIYGEGIGHLRVTRLRAIKKVYEWNGCHGWKKEGPRGVDNDMEHWTHIISLKDCHDIEVDRCEMANVGYLVYTSFCRNVSVHENRAKWSGGITRFEYGRSLRHYANWSSKVAFQCMWWGGNADSRRAGLALDSAKIVNRDIDIDLKPGDEGFKINNAGAYDISVQNNYAEYGECGFWGAKSRNVLISGNTARFMRDMAYDVEGDGNVIFANNIAVNSLMAGIGCYFYSNKVLITGNLVMVLDEDDDRYKGSMFVRLHSGGSPNTYSGIGKAVISGNLFISEVRGKKGQGDTLNRMIQIEHGRDVTISGNKFINGWIRTLPYAAFNKVTITNNEFDNRLAGNGPAIRLDAPNLEGIIRNNIIRRSGVETDPGFKDAAIHILGAPNKQMIVEGNLIEGWQNSISCKPKNPAGKQTSYIIRNNTISGSIDFLGMEEQFRKYDRDNLNMKTLQPVKARHIPEKNFKDEKYKMTF